MNNAPWMGAAVAEAGGMDELQTDVMRFMAILAFCLVAIFALVQSLPMRPIVAPTGQSPQAPPRDATSPDASTTVRPSAPPVQSYPDPVPRAATAEAIAAPPVATTVAVLVEPESVEPEPVDAPSADEPAIAPVRPAGPATAVLPDRDPVREETRAVELPTAAAVAKPSQMSLPDAGSAPKSAWRVARVAPTPAHEAMSADARTENRVSETRPAPPAVAPKKGFTLRFESDDALVSLVRNGRVAVYALSDDDAWRLRPNGRVLLFETAARPRQVHAMSRSTIPAVVLTALELVDAPADAEIGVTLPPVMRAAIDRYVTTRAGGSLVIARTGEVGLEPPDR